MPAFEPRSKTVLSDKADPELPQARPETPPPHRGIPALALVVVLIAITVGVIVFLITVLGGEDETQFSKPFTNPSVNQLAQATVQVVGLGADNEPLCSGSGTLVSNSGMILTNAHVVTREPNCDFEALGVAITVDAGRPPTLQFAADLLAIDPDTDLAVIQISEPLHEGETMPTSFPALALGDSDAVGIGDDIRILGYPEIGGDTITFTNGSVAGFTAQAGIGDRALIKTDATIAGGNSGGAAVDAEGRLIGIPTKARATEDGPAVDCRPLADTNGDGNVDELDNCVPIGGFLNGLRPINLAGPLLEQAKVAAPQPLRKPTPKVEVELSRVYISAPRFSLGQSEDAPTEQIVTAQGGTTELCLFVNWDGIPNGAQWDGLWYYNHELVEEYSLFGQSWDFGEQGTNFWMCAIDDARGLAAGLYELGFFLDSDLVFAEGIVLTTEAVDVIETVWENATDTDLCSLAINPNGSGPVGLNELPPGRVLSPGETATVPLPPGPVVVEAYDCNGQPVADAVGELTIESGQTYLLQRSGATASAIG